MRSCNLCANRGESADRYPMCLHPKAAARSVDLVDGTSDVYSLHYHRRVGWLIARVGGLCGREGRWFRARGVS